MIGGGHLEEGEADALRPQLIQQRVQNADVGNAKNLRICCYNGQTPSIVFIILSMMCRGAPDTVFAGYPADRIKFKKNLIFVKIFYGPYLKKS
jgi:hypothetical protein